MHALCKTEHFVRSGKHYAMRVYEHTSRSGCHTYSAETQLSPEDKIITSGLSLDQTIREHLQTFPLALRSRRLSKRLSCVGYKASLGS